MNITTATSVHTAGFPNPAAKYFIEEGLLTVGDVMKFIKKNGARTLYARIPNVGTVGANRVFEVIASIEINETERKDYSHNALVALWQIANPAHVQDRSELVEIAKLFFENNTINEETP